jgi:outer membrane murein-binding lipoprotein Lpp
MKKRVLMIAAVVSGTLAISGCTTNPYTGEREAVNPVSAQVLARWSAQASARSPLPNMTAAKAR